MHGADNLRSSRAARAAWVVGPALLAILAASGVVARPALDLARMRSRLDSMNARAVQGRDERALLADFGASGGFVRLAAADERVRALLPSAFSALEAQSALRLLARANGVELSTLDFGATRAGEFEVLEDQVLVQEVELCGRGLASGWIALVGALSGRALFAVVVDFDLRREPSTDERFEARITIGFLYTVPASTHPAGDEEGS